MQRKIVARMNKMVIVMDYLILFIPVIDIIYIDIEGEHCFE